MTGVTDPAHYWNPTRRIFGEGSFHELPEVLSPLTPKNIILVLGKASFRNSAHYGFLERMLSNYRVHEAPPVLQSPTVLSVEEHAKALKHAGKGNSPNDVVIGIGGGSVLDEAKTLALLLTQENQHLAPYLEKKKDFIQSPLPCIAIPTTAGTGSEVTPYASLETAQKQKISLSHPWLYPHTALIDPILTHSTPSYLTASTGFDALSQAIESFWAKSSTEFSKPHALRAIPLLLKNMETVVKKPLDPNARSEMALASLEAGLAISQTRTTAVHAVSYPLTTLFGIPHGHACALTLSSFMRYNESAIDTPLKEILLKEMGCASFSEASLMIETLMEKTGLERSLHKLGIDTAGLEKIVENAFRADRINNNPRPVTAQALYDMLQRLSS